MDDHTKLPDRFREIGLNRHGWPTQPAAPPPGVSDDTGEWPPLADESAPPGPAAEYTALGRELAKRLDAGLDDAEADRLRDRMDDPWRRMTPAERTAAQLDSINWSTPDPLQADAIAPDPPPDERHVWSRADHTLTPLGDAPPPGLVPASEAVPRGRNAVWFAGGLLVVFALAMWFVAFCSGY